MPQSLSQVILHIVFSTKDRRPWIDPPIRPRLHAYLATVCRDCACEAYRVGGHGRSCPRRRAPSPHRHSDGPQQLPHRPRRLGQINKSQERRNTPLSLETDPRRIYTAVSRSTGWDRIGSGARPDLQDHEFPQPQSGCEAKPRVGAQRLPWVNSPKTTPTATRLRPSPSKPQAKTPVGFPSSCSLLPSPPSAHPRQPKYSVFLGDAVRSTRKPEACQTVVPVEAIGAVSRHFR